MKISSILQLLKFMLWLCAAFCDVVVWLHDGQSAVLPNCSSSGTPSWKKNRDRDVDFDDPNVNRLPNGSLEIKNVTEHDAGIYTCTPPGERPKKIVALEYPTKINTSTVIPEGGNLTLKCKANHYPNKPEVSWYKDGKLINETDNPRWTVNTSEHIHVMEITPFLKIDVGEYYCNISYPSVKFSAAVKIEPIILEFDVHLAGAGSRCARISGGLLLAAMLVILFVNFQH